MRFVKRLTVTAGSLESAPSTQTVRLIKGTLTHIDVGFRSGCAWMVSVVILDRNLQVAPANPEYSFVDDDHTMSFSMNYPITDEPYELTLNGWSPDANYDHVITFRFDVDTQDGDDREILLAAMADPFKPYG